jgi:hypothetical protein
MVRKQNLEAQKYNALLLKKLSVYTVVQTMCAIMTANNGQNQLINFEGSAHRNFCYDF